MGLPDHDVFLTTADGVRLHAYFLRLTGEARARSAPTMLYFHGNAGNIGHLLFNAKHLLGIGCNVLMVEYRGYGRSEGRPSEAGLVLDAQAGLDFLAAQESIDTSRIIVFGRSLGGAVGIALAAANPGRLAALIVENTFTSVVDMVDVAMPLFSKFKFLCTNPWLSRERIGALQLPMLFISGLADELVPASHMAELYERARSSALKRLISFADGTHNDTWMCDGYFEALSGFVNGELANWLSQRDAASAAAGSAAPS